MNVEPLGPPVAPPPALRPAGAAPRLFRQGRFDIPIPLGLFLLVLRRADDVDFPAGQSRGQPDVCPFFPIARDSCESATTTNADFFSSSMPTFSIVAGFNASAINTRGSGST